MEQQMDYKMNLFKRVDDDFYNTDNYNNTLLKREDSNKPIEGKFKNNFLTVSIRKRRFHLIFSGL